jgi:hypothetical protein
MLLPSNQEEILERSELRKNILGWSPDEGDLYSSETKHDTRTVTRPTFVFLDKEITGTKAIVPKKCLGFESQ